MRVPFVSRAVVLLLLGVAVAGAQNGPARSVGDFCFVHISDSHVLPRPFGTTRPATGDSSPGEIAWVCEQAAKPQVLVPQGIQTPPPAFVVHTGDLTEYGIIHETWNDVLSYFKSLKVPFYITPGNHDNTWTAIMPMMRQRYKGDLYSFDESGCHFVAIDTATPQEPLPTVDQRVLTWLSSDLQKIRPGTPVFVFCHHPLSSTEFANPFDQLRLLELLEQHNTVAVLMGHGHGARRERWSLTDSVMGGSTYGPNAGYSILSVDKGILRVVYRYRDQSKPMAVILEKPIAPQKKPALQFETLGKKLSPGRNAPKVRGPQVGIRVRLGDGQAKQATASIDDSKVNSTQLQPAKAGSGGSNAILQGLLPTTDLVPGMHFVRVIADLGDCRLDRAQTMLLWNEPSPPPEVLELPAGMKAGPVFLGQDVVACTTAGQVLRASFGRGRPTNQVLLDVGVEILHPPAVVDNTLYFSAAEKGVHALSPEGKLLWRWQAPGNAAVYGTPAVAGNRLFVGDLEGLVHAIDRTNGKSIWSRRHAQFSIEQPLLLDKRALYFGAWDGFVYCVDAEEGSLKWKTRGPTGNRDKPAGKSRYYAPADCTPVVIGERLFVCDRGHVLGSYSLSGNYLGEIASDVAAIGASEDGKSLYARGLSKTLACYDATGKSVWSASIPMGRFPNGPREVGGKVYACSNKGLLSVVNAENGKLLWDCQVTPQLYVMAGILPDAQGNVYVAGMDGTLSRVQPITR